MVWSGWDGTQWSLTNPDEGIVMMPGLRGWSMPPVNHYKDSYASVAGTRWRGYQVGEREVFWPIQIYSDAGSNDWIMRDSAFWRTMHPRRLGTWSVTQPDGSTRSLTLRFKDDGTQEFQIDPVQRGWGSYGITLAAEQPFWAGDLVVGSWTTGAGSNFFNTTGAPAFNISPGNSISNARINNPGDEASWPVWVLDGPFTSFGIMVGGKTIGATMTVGSGHQLVIDTDPVKRSALLDGADVMSQITQAGFAPLPDGMGVDLSLAMVGSGRITVKFTPLYYRAW
jgi:hypothetical protein